MKKSYNLGVLVFSLYAATVALCAPAALAQTIDPPATHPFAQSKPIPGRYIVVFKNSVSNPAAEATNVMRGLGGQVDHIYSHALKGFAATLPEAALQGIRNNPNVDYIEQDQTVALNQTPTSPEYQATWGLDRIDQADRPLDTLYHFNYTGAGVNAFIIDTGIRPDHVEFSGRLLTGYNVVNDANGTNDCNGHGTHVAGTVGGTTWGVAKGVTLIPVRVLNCKGSGTWSGVIAGVDWVAGSPLRPAAANMSLGGGASTSVNAAVAGAVSKGVTMVVAAGNSNANACNYSPSGEPSAITVGATTSSDARASYSNYGSCVDIFAPGSSITSAWNTSDTATNTISGTSMAAPHVTGVAVLALAANSAASPAAVASFLTTNATANRLSSIGTGSPNLLVYSLAAGAPTEPAIQVVAVKSLVGGAAKLVNGWRASATVTMGDPTDNYAAVANATVQGSFSPGGTASCVTDSTGSCTMSSARIKTNTGSTVITVTGVSGSNLTYDSSQNSVSWITIAKP
jgi:subtilisin family serine protease